MKQAILACFITALLIAFLSPFLANAQKWASVGTKWNYTKVEAFNPITWPSEWKVVDTMSLKGKLCSIIQNTVAVFDTNNRRNLTMITYEDKDIVYWYRPALHDFTVLYDFNKIVGESWDIRGLQAFFPSTDTTICSIKMTVTKTGIDTINGIPLKTMLVTSFPSSSNFSGKIIQYIGSLNNIRPNPDFSCKPISETNDYYGLRCFESDFIGFHDFKIVPYCAYSNTGINEMKNGPAVSFSPNPFDEFLTLTDIESGTLTILNAFGQEVFYKTIKDSLSLRVQTDSWPSGIYWYRLHFQNQDIINGKLIKQ